MFGAVYFAGSYFAAAGSANAQPTPVGSGVTNTLSKTGVTTTLTQ